MKQVLLRAINIIEERGWTKGHYSTPSGRVCLSRAINDAAKEFDISEENRMKIRALVGTITGTSHCLACYNDRGKTTKQDVIRVLNEAAEKFK